MAFPVGTRSPAVSEKPGAVHQNDLDRETIDLGGTQFSDKPISDKMTSGRYLQIIRKQPNMRQMKTTARSSQDIMFTYCQPSQISVSAHIFIFTFMPISSISGHVYFICEIMAETASMERNCKRRKKPSFSTILATLAENASGVKCSYWHQGLRKNIGPCCATCTLPVQPASPMFSSGFWDCTQP